MSVSLFVLSLRQRLDHVRGAMLAFPHVTGVGLGWKEQAGRITDVTAWRVYVKRKLSRADLPAAHTIPAYYAGLPTDVITSSSAISAAAPKLTPSMAFRPGMTLSNLHGIMQEQAVSPNTSGLGTLGFLALVNGIRRREIVLVSNRHVLLAHGAAPGDPIYAPRFSRSGETCVIRASALEPIARVVDDGAEENHPYRYDGAPEEYFVDCASARLLTELPDHQSFLSPDPPQVRVRRVSRLHPLDVLGQRSPRVSKIGSSTGVTFGRVVDVAAPVENSPGPTRQNNIMIRGAEGPFVMPGDSGALVLNEHDEAIGLVWGRNDVDPAIAYACHIHPVLDRLGVTLMSGGLS